MMKKLMVPRGGEAETIDLTQEEEDYRQQEEDDIIEYKRLFEYRKLRQYPPLGDQLDAIWEQFKQMRTEGLTLVLKADTMLDTILAEKEKYKPPG